MDILIKGMKMPKSCFECVCKHKFFSDMRCYEFPDFEFDGTEKFPHMEDRSHYCPLIPVQQHGDLIDRDEQIERARRLKLYAEDVIAELLNTATALISAERSE